MCAPPEQKMEPCDREGEAHRMCMGCHGRVSMRVIAWCACVCESVRVHDDIFMIDLYLAFLRVARGACVRCMCCAWAHDACTCGTYQICMALRGVVCTHVKARSMWFQGVPRESAVSERLESVGLRTGGSPEPKDCPECQSCDKPADCMRTAGAIADSRGERARR